MFDVLILGGTVVDGTGTPGVPMDVGITTDNIAALGDLSDASGRRTIDATGLTVAPGFIDTHAHSDGALLLDPQHANGLRQGITTEILGQDGLSYAPLSSEDYLMYRRYLSGIYGLPPENIATDSVETFLGNYHNCTAINIAYPIPHGALRISSVGFHDQPLIGDVMKTAKTIVANGMEQGAIGLSTGMSYFPNSWSDTEELIELCQVVAKYGGTYITHLRNVHPERGFGGGGVTEALEIGRRSKVNVHFSHFRTSVEDAGQTAELMEEIDRAKAEGVNCTMELYPYPTGSGYPMMFLPPEVNEGGPDAILESLQDPVSRRRIATQIDEQHIRVAGDDSILTHVPSEQNRHLQGRSISHAAQQRGISPGELICTLLLEEKLTVGFLQAPPADLAGWEQSARDAVDLMSNTRQATAQTPSDVYGGDGATYDRQSGV